MKRIFWSWKNLTRWHFKIFISCFLETLVTIPERIYTHEKVLFNATYFKLSSMPYNKLNRKSIKMPSSSYGIFQQMKSSDIEPDSAALIQILKYYVCYACLRMYIVHARNYWKLYNVPWTAQFSSLNSQNPIFVWFFYLTWHKYFIIGKNISKNIFYLVQWDSKRWR